MSAGEMRIDSLIFDMDGTLWDSRRNICRSWNMIISERYPHLGAVTVEKISGYIGKPLPDITRGLYPQLSKNEVESLTQECCEKENEYLSQFGGELYEGLEETLKKLSERCGLYIVSNCQQGYIEAFFAAHGIQKYFFDYECNGTTGMSKADNIKLIVKRNNLTSPAYVGDTELDGKSAREANIPFLWASYGFGNAVDYDAKLDNFTDLERIIMN